MAESEKKKKKKKKDRKDAAKVDLRMLIDTVWGMRTTIFNTLSINFTVIIF